MDEGIEYKSLNPKCKKGLYMKYLIEYAILAGALFAVWFFAKNELGNYYLAYEVASISALVVSLIYIIIAPQIFFRHYRYAITAERIDVCRGIIIIRRTMVPIERIHQVEVVRGPINNMLGLANVQVTTAGGTADIQFLDISEAERIALELNTLVNSIIKGRKKDE